MSFVRRGGPRRTALGALASQVHPVFMLPPLAASATGAVLAGRLLPVAGGLHLTAVFLAVYTAHLKDGYVDFHRRGEDDDHPLTARGCRTAIAGSVLGCLVAVGGLAAVAGPLAAGLTLPCLAIGYFHAPQLDTGPVTATTGYPAGIALSLLGGTAAHGGRPGAAAIGLAAVLLVLLSGVKIVDDADDVAYDRSIGKRTVAVVLGVGDATRLAYGLLAGAVVGTLALGAVGVLPLGVWAGAAAFAGVAALARRAEPGLATMLLVRGAYVYLALLVAAVWFRPLG